MIPMPLPTIYALKFRPDLKININIARLRDEKEQLRKNGDEFGWGNCRYDIAENFWGDKLCRSAYKRSPDERHDADFILITHDHYDHFSPEYISKIAKLGSILVVPEKMSAKAREVADAVGRIETVKPAVYREIGGLEFETIPAYNALKPFHPRSAEWVGYVLRIDGKRIYIAGDTDATGEAAAVKCDIAIVPIGGTYTMDAKKAAELVNTIRPEIAIPVHYGSIVGKPSDGDVFAENVKSPVKVEFKILF